MIIFDGKNLEDFGVCAVGRGSYGAPARDVEIVHVPGRNGDVVFDNGSYLNAVVTFPDCSIQDNFSENFKALRNFLMQKKGYCRLETDYFPDEYRLARLSGGLEPSVHTARNNNSGTFTLTFDCRPQRWLKSGEKVIDIPLQRKENDTFYVRMWFTDYDVAHDVIITTSSGTPTTVCEDSTQFSVKEFTVPAGNNYADISCSGGINTLTIDGRVFDYRLSTYDYASGVRSVSTDFGVEAGAEPIWEIIPASSAFSIKTRSSGETRIEAADVTHIFKIDTEAYTAAQRSSGQAYWSSAASEVSGDLPLISTGRTIMQIGEKQSSGSVVRPLPATARVRVTPRTWRV